jgi:hypothetical protein
MADLLEIAVSMLVDWHMDGDVDHVAAAQLRSLCGEHDLLAVASNEFGRGRDASCLAPPAVG